MILSTWVTSKCLEFLDAKDNLYNFIEKTSSLRCMPITKLLPYDTNTINDIGILPSSPCLLKASLGSGGFGIYFIKDINDILTIMKWHKEKAEQTPGFIESLTKDFGRVPLWSLQEFIPSVRYYCYYCCLLLLLLLLLLYHHHYYYYYYYHHHYY